MTSFRLPQLYLAGAVLLLCTASEAGIDAALNNYEIYATTPAPSYRFSNPGPPKISVNVPGTDTLTPCVDAVLTLGKTEAAAAAVAGGLQARQVIYWEDADTVFSPTRQKASVTFTLTNAAAVAGPWTAPAITVKLPWAVTASSLANGVFGVDRPDMRLGIDTSWFGDPRTPQIELSNAARAGGAPGPICTATLPAAANSHNGVSQVSDGVTAFKFEGKPGTQARVYAFTENQIKGLNPASLELRAITTALLAETALGGEGPKDYVFVNSTGLVMAPASSPGVATFVVPPWVFSVGLQHAGSSSTFIPISGYGLTSSAGLALPPAGGVASWSPGGLAAGSNALWLTIRGADHGYLVVFDSPLGPDTSADVPTLPQWGTIALMLLLAAAAARRVDQ